MWSVLKKKKKGCSRKDLGYSSIGQEALLPLTNREKRYVSQNLVNCRTSCIIDPQKSKRWN